MKILKSNTKEVFDTDNIDFVGIYSGEKPDISKSLHLYDKELTDYDFLKLFFPEQHKIFKNFGGSFYYIVESVTADFPGIGKVEISKERAEQIKSLQKKIRDN